MKIERPAWYDMAPFKKKPWNDYVESLNHWFTTHVEPINKMLSEGVEVISADSKSSNWWTKCSNIESEEVAWVRKALLINITPIKRESALDLIKDILESDARGELMNWEDLHDKLAKARAVLERPND